MRFSYSSMTTPQEIYDYDMASGERQLRKRQRIPSGHDPSRYVTRRIFATAPDGERVPISILHRRDLVLDGKAPLLLYGYGAYGHALSASFSTKRLSLVDRGFVYAIAHVRGGTDKGWHWYTDGKLAHKRNTFADFIAAGRALIEAGYTGPGRIVAQGSPEELTHTGAEGQIRFHAVPALPLHLLLEVLPAGSSATEPAPGQYLVTGDVTPELLATLTAWCAGQHVMAEDLAVQRRTLEDVFLDLTGRELRP